MTGVCYRLTKLTTIDENSANMKLNEIYPEHFSALNKADLLKNFEAPTLRTKAAELEAALEDEVRQATKKRRERDRKRALYFKVGFSHYWQKPIHKQSTKSNQGSRLSCGYASICLTTVSPTYANYSKAT
jgi:ribosomal protein S13